MLALGQEIVIFRRSSPSDLDWLFLGPCLLDSIRSSEETLAALKLDNLRVMGADESARQAQLSLYREMLEYLAARPDRSAQS